MIGFPPAFVNMFKELHRNMKARVTFNGSLSDEISIDNGVNQGDIPAPTLSSLYFAVVLTYDFHDCNIGIKLRFRTSGNTRSKTSQVLIRELLYRDDADFIAHTEEDMQTLMDRLSEVSTAFGLTISLKRLHLENLTMNLTSWYRLGVVDTLVYLGSTISRADSLDAEIHTHIQKASVSFGKLEKRLWSDRCVTINTKVTVYQTCFLTTILYYSGTWTKISPELSKTYT